MKNNRANATNAKILIILKMQPNKATQRNDLVLRNKTVKSSNISAALHRFIPHCYGKFIYTVIFSEPMHIAIINDSYIL